MTDDTKPQGTVQIALRISPDLRERVKAAAEANNRSVNSELTATLEEKYPALEWRELKSALDAALNNILSMPHDERKKFLDSLPEQVEAAKRNPSSKPDPTVGMLMVIARAAEQIDALNSISRGLKPLQKPSSPSLDDQ